MLNKVQWDRKDGRRAILGEARPRGTNIDEPFVSSTACGAVKFISNSYLILQEALQQHFSSF